ncbi:MAG: LPS export ABC transporter periplasmic protein LptC [Candidatus Aminicenantes bacterium]|nr:LPS export ABC transporter periplasmic protein LptC [Candidatus Aminicenantes bacterium]
MIKKKMNYRLPQIIKVISAGLFLVVLVIIVVNLFIHSRKTLKVPYVQEVIDKEKIDKKEKIKLFEVKEGQKENFQIKAEKHYLGKDENYHLEGNVEIVFLKKKEGEDVFVKSEEIVYDKNLNYFRIYGEARIKFKDSSVKSSSFEYDAIKEIIKSQEGVKFISKTLACSARNFIFSVKNKKVEFNKNVRLQLPPSFGSPSPVDIEAERFDYWHEKKSGEIQEKVRLFHGDSQAECDILRFELSADERQIKKMLMKGQVEASIIDESRKGAYLNEEQPVHLYMERQDICADEIAIDVFFGLSQIRSIEASGNCSFKFISSPEKYTLIQGEKVGFYLHRKGDLREFYSSTKAKIIEHGESYEDSRRMEGEYIELKNYKNTLRIAGNNQMKARVRSLSREISADVILFSLKSDDFQAKGEVKAVFGKGKPGENFIGFFSNEHPVFITAEEMRYFAEDKRFSFSENVKIWQQDHVLLAKDIIWHEQTGILSSTGGVKSMIPFYSNEKEKKRVEISANQMNFDPEKNIISYSGKSLLEIKNLKLQANNISVNLDSENGSVKNIFASGEVVIFQNSSEGRGKEAFYDMGKEIVILSGNPVLIDKDKGRTEGDKLTFHLSDGKIVVENKGRERSTTVIKS